MTKDEAREEALYYARSGREAELTKKLSHDGFEYRGQARSRYRSRLFKQGRERPSNEQFDEGFDAGYDFAVKAERKKFAEYLRSLLNGQQSGKIRSVSQYLKELEAE